MMKLIWPEDDHHRWTDLALKRRLENEIVVYLGSGDSGKSYFASKFILCHYWLRPRKTLWMVSSTELRGAELRIWGAIKGLFNRGRERYPELEGNVIDSKHCISTDTISEDQSEARLLTRGIIFIPCKQGSQWIGMGAYAGIKPPKDGYLGHCGDEVSFMQRSFLDAYANWYGKENFLGMMLANPFDLEDPSCVAAEPETGWENWIDTEKTQEWRSKFYGAWVVAFDGRDSPNFDPPVGEKAKYGYLVGPKKLTAVTTTHGADSWQYFNQCVGKPRPHAATRRVITKSLCEHHRAFEDVIWDGSTPITTVVSLDAAYGGVGGDRCIIGGLQFGKDLSGTNIISCLKQDIVPVSGKNPEEPEVQIAKFCKTYCDLLNVPPRQFFFDARSTLAVRLAQYFGPEVNAVDFGGSPSVRPVSMDEYIWDGEEKTRRLKLCNEHYSKFVTELWFTIYYLIIGEQMRNLPKDTSKEGCQREWKYTKGNKIEVEAKDEMKTRTSQSPDLFDCLVTGVEGARRLGFQIKKVGNQDVASRDRSWIDKISNRAESIRSRHRIELVRG